MRDAPAAAAAQPQEFVAEPTGAPRNKAHIV